MPVCLCISLSICLCLWLSVSERQSDAERQTERMCISDELRYNWQRKRDRSSHMPSDHHTLPLNGPYSLWSSHTLPPVFTHSSDCHTLPLIIRHSLWLAKTPFNHLTFSLIITRSLWSPHTFYWSSHTPSEHTLRLIAHTPSDHHTLSLVSSHTPLVFTPSSDSL